MTQKLSFDATEEELEKRSKNWQAPPLKHPRGVLGKYSKLVSSASKSAVTDYVHKY